MQASEATSGEGRRSSVEQTELTQTLSSSHTCYIAQHHVGWQDNSSDTKITRNIPITIEIDNCEDSNDTENPAVTEQRQIPIAINKKDKVESKIVVDDMEVKRRESGSMISIPIHRVSSVPCDSDMVSSPPRLGRDSKIKMGTAAIRIPIQVQRSLDSEDTRGNNVSSKPPASVRTVPILRQSLSDSGVGRGGLKQHQIRSRNSSTTSAQEDKLQKVHEELEVILLPLLN